jgi:hypothetical protein
MSAAVAALQIVRTKGKKKKEQMLILPEAQPSESAR